MAIKQSTKQFTGATKYAVRSFFCLPSDEDPERAPNKSGVKLAANYNKPDPVLIEHTTAGLKRLNWSNDQGRLYLQETFNKSSRHQLSKQELQKFLSYLRSLPPSSSESLAINLTEDVTFHS